MSDRIALEGETVATLTDGGTSAAERGDLASVARGGTLNMVGAVGGALLGFLLVLVVTRGFDATVAGIFFESVALFSLLRTVAQWGAEVGTVRSIPRLRVLGRTQDIRHSIRAGLVPVVVAGAVLAVVMFVFAGPLGRLLTNGRFGPEFEPVIHVMAPFVPLAAALTVALSITRGFGTMVPSVLVDKLGNSTAQLLLAALVVALGLSSTALALAYVVPIAIGLAVSLIWVGGLLRRWEAAPLAGTESPMGARHTFVEFWRFSAPRGLASVFAVAILWLDTLLIGSLRSPGEAGVYAAATRYLTVGQFVGVAILQVVGPKLAQLLAQNDRSRTRSVYATSTAWLILASWPLYVTMIVMAPALLSVFGARYLVADGTLMILGAAMLVATGVGTVDAVLLMAGKSSWNLGNTILALVANVGLNLLLIPRMGISGAAIAWGVSILLNNLLPLAQVWHLLRVHPFGRGWVAAAGVSAVSFTVAELLARWALGSGLAGLAVGVTFGLLAYGILAWRFRRPLRLVAFRAVLDRRRTGDGDPASALVTDSS